MDLALCVLGGVAYNGLEAVYSNAVSLIANVCREEYFNCLFL